MATSPQLRNCAIAGWRCECGTGRDTDKARWPNSAVLGRKLTPGDRARMKRQKRYLRRGQGFYTRPLRWLFDRRRGALFVLAGLDPTGDLLDHPPGAPVGDRVEAHRPFAPPADKAGFVEDAQVLGDVLVG